MDVSSILVRPGFHWSSIRRAFTPGRILTSLIARPRILGTCRQSDRAAYGTRSSAVILVTSCAIRSISCSAVTFSIRCFPYELARWAAV